MTIDGIEIDDVRLPLQVEESAVYSLTTSTLITTGYGGAETRFAKQRPKIKASFTVGPDDSVEVAALYRRQIGPRWAFKAKDYSDFVAEGELLTENDDGSYSLVRNYGDYDRPAYRRILLPIEDTLVVTVDGNVTTAFNVVDAALVPTSPPSWTGLEVRWSGEHDFAVRFDGDAANITVLSNDFRTVQVGLVEVLGPIPTVLL